jgi:hypothetical protein
LAFPIFSASRISLGGVLRRGARASLEGVAAEGLGVLAHLLEILVSLLQGTDRL